MMPDKSDSRWKALVQGKISHNFAFVAAGLCVSRNQRALRMNMTDEAKAVDDVYAFFEKYQKVLSGDITAIFG